ncbi:MAG: hypothetical protein OHK0023_24360 [Anaerolineae bacterium]
MLQQLLEAFVNVPSPDAMRQFAASVPAPLLDALVQVLEQVVIPSQPPEVADMLRARLSDLQRARGV